MNTLASVPAPDLSPVWTINLYSTSVKPKIHDFKIQKQFFLHSETALHQELITVYKIEYKFCSILIKSEYFCQKNFTHDKLYKIALLIFLEFLP